MNTLTLAFAAIELLSPVGSQNVVLLPDCQRSVIARETRSEREAELKKYGKKDAWRQSREVVFTWRPTAGESGPWELALAKDAAFTDAQCFLLSDKTNKQGIVRYVLPRANLEIATTYHWRVTGNVTCGEGGHARKCGCKKARSAVTSAADAFVTEDLAPRWIAIEGRVGNFRDLGGRIGRDGRRVRQGMIYRSQGLNDNSVDGTVVGRNRLMVEDRAYLTGTLGIRTDLDLRGPGETAKMTTSPLGASVQFVNNSSSCYKGIFSDSGKKVMAKNFRLFCDRANYPILFHCIAGADRTGALGYVLNGVLGVARREMETDWESTFYPHIPYCDKKGELTWNSEAHFDQGFARYGSEGDSWNRRVELYLMDCGITADEIAKFREIMLQ